MSNDLPPVRDDPYNGYAGTYGPHYGFANSTMVSLLSERGIVW